MPTEREKARADPHHVGILGPHLESEIRRPGGDYETGAGFFAATYAARKFRRPSFILYQCLAVVNPSY